MKRTFALLVAMVVCLALTACGGEGPGKLCAHEEIMTLNGVPATCTTAGLSEGKACASCNKVLVEQAPIPATGHTIATVAEKAPTCTSAGATASEQCSSCGFVQTPGTAIPALGHTGEWSCDRCSYSSGSWDKYYFVDDFNDPTDEWYIGMKSNVVGTFSNSATTDSKLEAYILYGQTDDFPNIPFDGVKPGREYFNIFLYEYGSHQVKNSSTYYIDDYVMKIKTESGEVYEVNCILPTSQDRIWVYDHVLSFDTFTNGKNATKLKNILMQGGKLKIVLVNDERPVQEYAFEFDASNFKDQISKLG